MELKMTLIIVFDGMLNQQDITVDCKDLAKKVFEAQTVIGWCQHLNGSLAQVWATEQDDFLQSKKLWTTIINGQTWAAQ
eukprot:10702442-Ditylum_brightwellii.AAC.1